MGEYAFRGIGVYDLGGGGLVMRSTPWPSWTKGNVWENLPIEGLQGFFAQKKYPPPRTLQ